MNRFKVKLLVFAQPVQRLGYHTYASLRKCNMKLFPERMGLGIIYFLILLHSNSQTATLHPTWSPLLLDTAILHVLHNKCIFSSCCYYYLRRVMRPDCTAISILYSLFRWAGLIVRSAGNYFCPDSTYIHHPHTKILNPIEVTIHCLVISGCCSEWS